MNILIPNMSEFIITLISFLCLLFIVKKKVIPKFNNLYYKRVNLIKNSIQKAEDMESKARYNIKKYKDQLQKIEMQKNQIIQNAKIEALSIINTSRNIAKKESSQIYAEMNRAIQNTKNQIIRECKLNSVLIASQMCKKIFKEAFLIDNGLCEQIFEKCLLKIKN